MDRLLYITWKYQRKFGEREAKKSNQNTITAYDIYSIEYVLFYGKCLVTFWSYRRVWSLDGHHWWVSLHGWISQTSRFLSLCSVGGLVTESPTSILYYYNLVSWYSYSIQCIIIIKNTRKSPLSPRSPETIAAFWGDVERLL